jgi:2-polyprenyl-6-methoxyphenol hydroxylase-like FAD-dependent oxidoreductase
MHIIIVGAGTGGLALAHALRKANANITFAVYERDRTRKDGLYGYRVGISPDGSRSLAACLPPDLFEVFKHTTAITPDYFNMFTEQYAELLSINGFSASSPNGAGAERSVSRMTLRQLLLTGLEDAVHFDKAFTHYNFNSDGTITAYFKDGTQVVGDLLVGADGTNSPVRRQYLPHAVLKETGLYGATAKLPLTEETRKLLTPKVLRGVTMFNAPHGDSCILHVMEFPWDHDGNLKNNVGGNDQELIKEWPGLNFDNTRDYIMLGFGSHRRRLPDNYMSLDGPSLHTLLLDRTSSWHPNLRKLFELSEPSTCFPINIRTTGRLKPWTSSAVTLIGDAIHTMTPGLGVGANTALLDAQILAAALLTAVEKGLPVVTAVGEYEQQMHTYAWDRVEKSLERFNADDAIYKPGLRGGLALMLMRGGMRVVNALPPVKRRMAAAMTAERGERD